MADSQTRHRSVGLTRFDDTQSNGTTLKSCSRSGERGSILFNAVWLGVVVNLLVFVIWIVALRLTQIAHFESAQAHAYWLARSEAMELVATLERGQSLVVPTVMTVPGGQLTVSMAGTTIIEVVVHVVSGAAVDNLHFSYDSLHQRVTDWSDRNPS